MVEVELIHVDYGTEKWTYICSEKSVLDAGYFGSRNIFLMVDKMMNEDFYIVQKTIKTDKLTGFENYEQLMEVVNEQ